MTTLIEINNEQGAILEADWLVRAEPVHRQLRPDLPSDYVGTLAAIFAGGARMSIATDGAQVLGLAVWRVLLKTSTGCELYVDDLVTDDSHRSSGVGAALLAKLEAHAQRAGASTLSLDSGTQRHRAHRFYLREGFAATAFRFTKPINRD